MGSKRADALSAGADFDWLTGEDAAIGDFVNAFIAKNRRERVFYELMTPKKRYRGISRFCHGARALLDPARIVLEGEDLERLPAFGRFVRDHAGPCLALSPFDGMNGRFETLSDAVEAALVCPDAVLILGSGFAVVFGEPEKGGRDKILLVGADAAGGA